MSRGVCGPIRDADRGPGRNGVPVQPEQKRRWRDLDPHEQNLRIGISILVLTVVLVLLTVALVLLGLVDIGGETSTTTTVAAILLPSLDPPLAALKLRR